MGGYYVSSYRHSQALARDLLQITAPPDRAIEIVRMSLTGGGVQRGFTSASKHAPNAAEVVVQRATVAGSGTPAGSSFGPNPLDPNDPASSATIAGGLPTAASGTLTELWRAGFNFPSGWYWQAGTDGDEIVLEGSDILVLRVETTHADALRVAAVMIHRE